MSRRRRLEEASKREGELERELARTKRRLARMRKRVEELGAEVPEESPSPVGQPEQSPEAKKLPASICPGCEKAATKLKLGPREYWTCKACQWCKPVGR